LTGDEAERVLDDLEEYGMIPTKPIYTEDSGGRGEAQDIDGPRGHVLVRCRSDRGHGARPDRDLRPRVPDG
jgi:hypothetical protein